MSEETFFQRDWVFPLTQCVYIVLAIYGLLVAGDPKKASSKMEKESEALKCEFDIYVDIGLWKTELKSKSNT